MYSSLYCTLEFCSKVPLGHITFCLLSAIYSHIYKPVLTCATCFTCHIHVQHYAAFVVTCNAVHTERWKPKIDPRYIIFPYMLLGFMPLK